METLQVLTDEHASGHAASGHAASGHAGAGDDVGDDAGDADVPHASHIGSAAECRICPVCRLIAAFRQLRPEVLAHLVTAGEELLAAAREFAASSVPPGAGPASTTPATPTTAASPPSMPTIPAMPTIPTMPTMPQRRTSPRQPQRIELD